jgi:signal transduction histidine kinase
MRWRSPIRSVRLRITVLTTTALAVGLLIAAIVLFAVLRRSLLDAQSGSGPRHAAELAALASKAPLPNPLPVSDSDPPTVLQVVGMDGRVVAASTQLGGTAALLAPSDRGRRVLHDVPGFPADESWLAEPTPATIGGRSVLLIVLTSLSSYERGVALVRNALLVTVPVLVVLVAALVWLVVGRALRPVETMRREVAGITAARLDRRVRQPATADEVGRLAGTLNHMLDRLQSSRDAQRRFVADASHELRTPIANIRVALEVANAHPAHTDWRAVAQDVLQQDERMERLTADLLRLARSEIAGARAPTGTAVDLEDLVRTELARVVPGDRRLVAGRVSSAVVAGDRDQLARMLSNLVDNALRHARRDVTISLVRGTASVELRVADDGAGIAPESRDAVFEPFVRLDEHRTRSRGGAGLGLAIVRDIVIAHGGTIQIMDNEPGAAFVVRLPTSR